VGHLKMRFSLNLMTGLANPESRYWNRDPESL